MADRAAAQRFRLADLVDDLVAGELGSNPAGLQGMTHEQVAARLGPDRRLRAPAPALVQLVPLPEAPTTDPVVVDVPLRDDAGAPWTATVRIVLLDAQFYERWEAAVLRFGPGDEDEPGRAALEAAAAERLAARAAELERQAAELPPRPPAPRPPIVTDDLAPGIDAALEELAQLGGDPDALRPHVRPSIRLRPAPPATTRTRFGGAAELPEGTPCPRRATGRPLHLLAQVDLAEVPRCPLTDGWPRSGTIAVFYDAARQPWGFEPGHADGHALVVVTEDERTTLHAPPADLDDLALLPCSGMTFALDGNVDLFDLPFDAEVDDPEVPQHRLAGRADDVQGDPRLELDDDPDDWTLLLQVDSGPPLDVDWGDVGRLYVYVRTDDLRAGRFDRSHVVLQCS